MTYNIKSFKDLRFYIAADLFRYMTSTSLRSFIRGWYIAGFRYTFFMRCCKYFAQKNILYRPLFLISRIALRHYSLTYGFQIPWQTNIGPGLSIGHFGSIIINPSSTIGTNCNITTGVLLGLSPICDEDGRFIRFEYPTIGNRVALGNNSKIIGGAIIGDDSIIGVNTVVTRSIPKKSIAVGAPAKIISQNGSSALVGSFHPGTCVEPFCH